MNLKPHITTCLYLSKTYNQIVARTGLERFKPIVNKRLKSDALYVSFKLSFQSIDNARILLILCSKYI